MNCESLYQESKWKRAQQRAVEEEQAEQIRQLSSSKKINPHSHSILSQRVSEQLLPFPDEQVLNIESSIPLLHATRLLQAIESIDSAKLKLEQGQFESARLREEARFVYCLWKMIDEEEIETRELKEIVYMIHEKPPAQLANALAELYPNEQAVAEFVDTWRALLHENQYYRSLQRIEQRRTPHALRDSKELNLPKSANQIAFPKSANEINFTLKESTSESAELRDYFLKSKDGISKSSKFLTSDSLRFPSDAKENSYITKARENAIVERLYQADKYKIRELYKKVEDEKREREEMESCTFKPELTNGRLRSASSNHRSASINGYHKAVQRMKVGQEKTRIQKEKIDYKPTGENYERLREKKPNPPSFLERRKKEEKVQFVIEFDIGKHKIKAKIREADDEAAIARNLCKIYCLKQDYFDQICSIIRSERDIYLTEQEAL